MARDEPRCGGQISLSRKGPTGTQSRDAPPPLRSAAASKIRVWTPICLTQLNLWR
jgi:hypothetical protein